MKIINGQYRGYSRAPNRIANFYGQPSFEAIDHRSTSLYTFLRRLRFSQWVLLLYPIFLFLIQRQRYPEDLYLVDTSAWIQIVTSGLLGLYALVKVLRYPSIFKNRLFKRPIIWLLLYYLLAVFSVGWSDRPDFTLYRSFEVLIFLILVTDATLSLGTFENSIKFQLCLGFLMIIIWQFTSLRYGISLDTLHNSLVPGAIIALVCTGWLIRGWVWKSIYLSIISSIILATSSATYLSLIFGIGVGVLFVRKIPRFLLVVLFLLFITSYIIVFNIDLKKFIFWGKEDYTIESASGRITTWEWVLEEKVYQRPILGYGFGVGETLARVHYSLTPSPMIHMHSIVMSAITNLGVVGLGFLIIFLLDTFRSIWAFKEVTLRPFIIAGTAALLMNSFSISSITSTFSLGWLSHSLFLITLGIYLLPPSRAVKKENIMKVSLQH